MERFECPLCGSPLSASRFAEVIQRHRGMQEQLEKLRAAKQRADEKVTEAQRRARELVARAKAKAQKDAEEERRRANDRLRKHQETARKLSAKIKELEDRLRRGETAQTEGLLEERALLAFLKENFRKDRFTHVGKGGDIVQEVCTGRDQTCGRIVYEVKKVQQWSNSHLYQAASARSERQADIAILITNRFPARRQYYFVERDVIVISPLAILPLVHTAREGLIHAHALSASGDQRKSAMRAVYDYLAGAAYIGHMKKIAQHFRDLEVLFSKEIDAHKKMWGHRLMHYRGVLGGVSTIHEKLRGSIALTGDRATGSLSETRELLPEFGASLSIVGARERKPL